MEAGHGTMAHLLALAALIAATIEYAEVTRRRAERRRALADLDLVHESGLRGLVRLFASSDSGS
jgi:hypothetical protein